jgi:hypothetical protein
MSLTAFGQKWKEMQEAGLAPKESMFLLPEEHSEAWHQARKLCKELVTISKMEKVRKEPSQ